MQASIPTLLLCAVTLLYAGPTAAATFGAMGYSAPTDTLTIRSQCGSRQECESGVLKDCRETSSQPDACQVLLWYRNACGAFAKASDGSYGSGWGTNETIATQWALKTCRQQGGKDCISKVYSCSTGRGRIAP